MAQHDLRDRTVVLGINISPCSSTATSTEFIVNDNVCGNSSELRRIVVDDGNGEGAQRLISCCIDRGVSHNGVTKRENGSVFKTRAQAL